MAVELFAHCPDRDYWLLNTMLPRRLGLYGELRPMKWLAVDIRHM